MLRPSHADILLRIAHTNLSNKSRKILHSVLFYSNVLAFLHLFDVHIVTFNGYVKLNQSMLEKRRDDQTTQHTHLLRKVALKVEVLMERK